MRLLCGDNLVLLRELPDNSVDAIVTDPPYGISFMNKHWDYDVPTVELWRECMRVLKPGGHMLVACGTRTQHRMVVNIEDAGFEIRDVVTWLYGSGFPKSLNISKAIDKEAGAVRDVIGISPNDRPNSQVKGGKAFDRSLDDGQEHAVLQITTPSTDFAKQWDGWGTALKPACEFFTLCRKPLEESTVAKNVTKWGTGGINVDGCRIGFADGERESLHRPMTENNSIGWKNTSKAMGYNTPDGLPPAGGRWPANLLLDEEAAEMLDEQSGILSGLGQHNKPAKSIYGDEKCASTKRLSSNHEKPGGASRFFYCAKASKSERNKGLEELHAVKVNDGRQTPVDNAFQRGETLRQNTHPTVKPIKLMEYLCKLITPPGGTVLDPFMGSGSTGIAAKNLGFHFIGMELSEEYFEIAEKRVAL